MEREYTVGALLVLVTIFVIALIIYFTVPEFSQSVSQIADEVFGTLQQSAQMGEEQYRQEEAKSVFESIKKCISQLKEKQEGKCTCYLDYKGLPEEYYIRLAENGKELRLEKGNLKVAETENINIEGLKFCILEKGLTYLALPPEGIYINSKGGALEINNKEFLKDTPEFYSLKEGDNQYICFVTADLAEEDAIKLRQTKDCKTGTVVLNDKMKSELQEFVQSYKRCKEHNKTENCKCGEANIEMPQPYGIQVSQKGKVTTFLLKGTNEKEMVDNNQIAKIVSTPWYSSTPYEIMDYKEGEKVEGQEKIVYYGNNQNIYLAEPEIKAVRGWPLCIENVNTYLKFNPSISKEEYKQKLLSFSKKSEPYFEAMYSTAKANDVDLFMIAAMAQQESMWEPRAVSSVGAAGLMQLMPDTAKGLGLFVPNYGYTKVNGKIVYYCNVNAKGACNYQEDERFNPDKNVQAGTKYVKGLIIDLDKDKNLDPTFENILASYNAGFGNVQKYKGVPPFTETVGYVKAICGYYEKLNTKVCYA